MRKEQPITRERPEGVGVPLSFCIFLRRARLPALPKYNVRNIVRAYSVACSVVFIICFSIGLVEYDGIFFTGLRGKVDLIFSVTSDFHLISAVVCDGSVLNTGAGQAAFAAAS